MKIGTLLVGRFLIEGVAGAGGMGTVYRARDTETGKTVAVKVLQSLKDDRTSTAAERFVREAQVLAELRHPHIVAYLADGQTPEGIRYLAMEWLEGEDVSQRLTSGPLPLIDCFTLLRIVTSALAVAHQRGIVHRDIKPSNLFMRGGRIEGTTLIDFGIARQQTRWAPLTRTGISVGTPVYMAPEQARGQADVGPGADIFALGCVLYESLVGVPPFVGKNEGALLAKVLFDEAPAVRSIRPAVPPELELLLSRMLAKDPAQRFNDASALAAALEHVPIPTENDVPPLLGDSGGSKVRIEDEQQPITVMVAVPPAHSALVQKQDASRPPSQETTKTDAQPQAVLVQTIGGFGARVEWLAEGSLVGIFTEGASAHDQVRQAARCSLLVRERWPDARIAICSGSGVVQDRRAVGEVVERAMLLAKSTGEFPVSSEAIAAAPLPEGVHLDALSAGLIDSRFTLTRLHTRAVLLAEKDSIDESRLLLGKPTPCMGRERELGTLSMMLNNCIDESQSGVVLVTAEPGLGKSRLRHELLRRLKARGTNIQVLLGSGDPMSVGSPYGILNQLLRRLCGIQSGEKPEVQQAKLQALLGPRLPTSDAQRIVEFLGEICGIHFPDEHSVKLRAARSDPQVMNEQVRQAFVECLRAESSLRPQLLILEDLHWGDALTVKLIDVALRELSDQPLMVLALARPEVEDLFPKLWSGRGLKRVQLSELSAKACERLIEQILGQSVDRQSIERMVAQAAGNALYLEELIRAFADGEGKSLPDTVLAMLQARLMRMDASVRRVLRGASVFGETFWRDGVAALLGRGPATQDLDSCLQALISGETIEQRRESRFPGQEEYGFRHGLMRDAAYSMLTGQDRVTAHRVAVQYLEQAGEQDPMVLAEHSQRGEDMERAVRHYVDASKQADAGYDLDGALLRAERGINCNAQGEALGILREIQNLSYYLKGSLNLAIPPGFEALSLLPRGSFLWCRGAATLFTVLSMTGQLPVLNDLVQVFTATTPFDDARGMYVEACANLLSMFSALALRDAANGIKQRMAEVGEPILAQDPIARGFYHFGYAIYLGYMEPEDWRRHEAAQQSIQAYTEAGALRFLAFAKNVAGSSFARLGRWQEAEQTLNESLALGSRLNDPMVTALARVSFTCELSDSPDPKLQEAVLVKAKEQLAQPVLSPIHTGMAQIGMANILIKRGQFQEAERIGRALMDLLMMMPSMRPGAYAILTESLVRQGRSSEARKIGEEGVQFIRFLGGYGDRTLHVNLALAEACHALGDHAAAKQALGDAQAELNLRASKIPDPASRMSFLHMIPTHARLLQLADSWAL